MRKNLLLALVLFCSSMVALAQSKISGKVTSADDGTGIPGVTVQIKGTSKGTQTDLSGDYSIDGASGQTLVFSFVGMQPQEVATGTKTIINVVLSNDAKALSEVVVTAQGIVREKKALGYAVTTVSKELINNRPEADISRVLQGKAPGVNITSTGGVSGSGTNITIRGYSSATGSNQPLFVVDGVPFNSGTNGQAGFTSGGQTTSSRMLDIDPNNIESVSVLKGLSATVLYGDQGRNGVILITTKSGGGKRRNAEVSLNQSYFQNTIASLPDYQNNYGGGFQQLTPTSWFYSNWGANFADQPTVKHPYGLSGVANIRNAFPEYAVDPTKPWGNGAAALVNNVVNIPNEAQPNIGQSFFRKGQVFNTSVQISGSSDKSGYNASIGYQNEQGFTPGNDLKKLNLGLGMNSQVTKKFSIRSSFTFANTDYKTPPLNAGYGSGPDGGIQSIFANVMYTPRNVNLGEWPYENPVDRSSVYYRGGNDITNPNWLAKYHSDVSKVDRFFTSSSMNYDINSDFSLTYRVGFDTYSENQERRYNKGATGGNVNIINGFYQSVNIKNSIWNHDVILNYNKKLSDKLNLTALVGANNRFDNYEQFGLASTGQLTFGLFNHTNFTASSSRNPFTGSGLNYTIQQRRIGTYANVVLDYSDYLFLNMSARNDWTSTVETENRRILYPGASLSFLPTSAFDIKSKVLNDLKLRVSYGTSAGFPSPYNTRNTLGQNARGWSDAGGSLSSTQSISNALGNPNLKPELHKEFEFGVESVMFNNRFKYDVSIYEKNTRDLITNAPIDPSTGYTSTFINIGRIRTRGAEVSATVTPVKTSSGLQWDITANYGKYKTIVMELGGGLEQVVIAGFTNLGNFAIPGKPFNLIMGSGIDKNANGEKIVLPNGQYKATNDLAELGDPNPAFTSSLINNLSYKGFNLSFMFEYRHKGVILSNTVKGVLARGLSKDTDQLDRDLTLILPGVQEDGSKNTVQVTAANYFFDNYFFTDEAVTFDGSTARLREASLSYNLPSKVIGKTPFKKASVTFTGSNLWFRALNMPKYVNFDTDVLSLGVGNGLGFDYLTGPSARRLGGTLSLTF
ncbi:SusC/RagA family TonB-linked outer membrane protein [Lacihabitans sp. LS3-19]|uniref:SusC/RagA family TonB-linked outer membrane protein n=1 Tax=Lacihabitans sp. LS3-19 TaxID=2487335 RepID=UPI0020CF2490|nr:SusC/RagA family TonB-linked outer membrane protein [Lacihabitans sp. LS3-19]MCP9767435.1 SusC/RagA family TonB-linked outer membrane protein [Lacihabitans sp. LS3-19]